MGGPRELLDRAEALAAADALLAEDGPRVLIVRGPAGIGKTSVLDALAARASERTVLRGRGTPLEQGFALGLARQLLGPDTTAAGDLGAMLHTLFLDLSERAEREPLLLVADDAHWADDVSLRLLASAGRRLEDVDCRLAIGVRDGDPRAEHEALAALAAEPATRVVTLEPLDADAVEQLVGTGLADAARRATGGNPLLIGELLRELPPGATPDDVESAAIERTVLARLLPLGDAPRAFAEATAVLGAGAAPHLAARRAGRDPDTAAEARDALVAAHIVASGTPGLEFVHPLVAAAVASSLPPGRLAREHARAARLLADAGEPPPVVAAHLLDAEPAGDPWAVGQLRAAAAAAMASGGTSEAARLLRRAIAEPPPPEELTAVLHEAGTAASRAGEADGTDLLRAALDRTTDVADRLNLIVEIGIMATIEGRLDEVMPLFPDLRRARDEAGPELRPLADARILQVTLRYGPLVGEGLALADTVDRTTEPRTVAERLLLGQVVEAMVLRNEPAGDVARVGRSVIGDEGAFEELVSAGLPMYPLLSQLAGSDVEEQLVERRLEHAIVRAGARGSLVSRFLGVSMRASLRAMQGLLDAADEEAEAAAALGREAGRGYDPIQLLIVRAVTAIERGDLATARAAVTRAGDLPDGVAGWEMGARAALLRLREGDAAAALGEATALGRRVESLGVRTAVWVAWRPVAARAHRLLGDHEAAQALAAEQLALAREFGSPRPIGEALTLAAELANDPIALLEEAVAVLEPSSARLARARALVAYGAALRRANRRADAREPLAAGRELADACGAHQLAEHARQELLAAGARPRKIVRTGVDALTASELRTAQLAAAGATNREIAAELFVTVKTVEDHLSAAYRKLDVRGRKELAGKLPGPAPMRTGVA